MKWYTRSAVVGLAVVFAAGCGAEGEQGPPGDSSEVTTERVEEHEECPEGGVEILVDGEFSDILCDGEQGEAAPAPDISIAQDPDECGEPGGVEVTIGEEEPFAICNGADGDGNGDSTAPDISIGEPEDCGEAGGYSLTIGEEDPIDICHGDSGEAGEASTIEVEELEPSATGPCVDGGVKLTVTTVDEQGDEQEDEIIVCGEQPIDPPEIGWCNTSFPPDIEKFDDETVNVFGQIYVEDFTGDQPGSLPEDDYYAEAGYVEVADDPDDDVDPSDDAWEWVEAELNEDSDFVDDNDDEFVSEFSELDAGEYYYLYRMTINDGDDWSYCGLEGDFEAAEYDTGEDPGWMEVSVAPTTIAGWDFEGENLDAGWGEDGDAYAQFSDPDAEENFYGDYEWTINNAWIESDEFPPYDYGELDGFDDFDDLNYYEFNSEMFGDFDEVTMDTEFTRSNAGPRQVQVVAEFDDGALAMLDEPIEIGGAVTVDVSADQLEAIEDDPAGDADIESYRIYGFEANNTGFQSGNMRVHDMEFLGF